MFVQQFFIKGLAHSSYLLGGSGTCAIVDPRRDVQVYLDAAKDMGMRITHVLETHLHADFISGHVDLARETGATIYAPAAGKCTFDHVAVKERDAIELEDMTLQVLETPGHTPEHVSYVVRDHSRGGRPAAVFCGDTLFVGDVGRPDLFPGIAQELASNLYDSLHRKLMKLPAHCQVYPAHGAGSLCGRAMGAMRTTTIGYEKLYNAALRIGTRQKFVESLTTNMPAAPDHFSRCSATNAAGPTPVHKLRSPEPIAPEQFATRARRKNMIVLDTRSYDAFGGQHVPGSYHIDFGGNFATFAGWMLPVDADILLVTDGPDEAAEATVWLRRVGLDRTVGYLDGGMFAWSRAGLPVGHVGQLSVHELRDAMVSGEGLALIDVRAAGEFEKTHIMGALHVPAPDLRALQKGLRGDLPIAAICSTGHRSSLAASLLKRQGFEQVVNVAGGMTAYAAAGYGPECPMCVAPHVPGVPGAVRA
jgi:hydroxyacylglutathione hydrolase